MVTKGDFNALQRKTQQNFDEVWRNFRDVRNDIAGRRKETEFELDDLEKRVTYVEQKLGIQSGK